MESPNSTNTSENCMYGALNRDSAWNCSSKIKAQLMELFLSLEPSNQTDMLSKLIEEDPLISQNDRSSYISINFAFAESLLIMIGLFTNLVVSCINEEIR